MLNKQENWMLGYIDKKHRAVKKALTKVVIIPAPKEQVVHQDIAEYLDTVLIPNRSEFTSHDASIGLGIFRISQKDSSLTRACKNFHNRFVMAAQRKFIAKGIKKGWPDLLIQWEGGKSLWLEIKRKGMKPQDYQLEVHSRLNKIGIPIEVPYDIEDVRALLAKYEIPNRERLQ